MYSIGTVLLNAFLLYLTRDTAGKAVFSCLRYFDLAIAEETSRLHWKRQASGML